MFLCLCALVLYVRMMTKMKGKKRARREEKDTQCWHFNINLLTVSILFFALFFFFWCCWLVRWFCRFWFIVRRHYWQQSACCSFAQCNAWGGRRVPNACRLVWNFQIIFWQTRRQMQIIYPSRLCLFIFFSPVYTTFVVFRAKRNHNRTSDKWKIQKWQAL